MYTQEDVKRVQARLLEMAKVIRDILEKHNIPYFITYGTLLGAVRHRGFIPWDDDFDFYLFDDSYNEAMSFLGSELPSSMFLENWETEPLYFHSWAHVKDTCSHTECEQFPQDGVYSHHGVSVDLYRIKRMAESSVEEYRRNENISYLVRRKKLSLITREEYQRRIDALDTTIISNSSEKEVFATVLPILKFLKIDEVLPLRNYLFEDTRFYGPNNAHAFLTKRYGTYLTIPPKEQQRPHYSKVIFY